MKKFLDNSVLIFRVYSLLDLIVFFFLFMMFDVSFIVVVVVKVVRSHERSMNYYCNQTREQKGGEKSQIFAEEKKRVEQLFFSLRLRHKMMRLDGGVFLYTSSLSFSVVFSTPADDFFCPQLHLK